MNPSLLAAMPSPPAINNGILHQFSKKLIAYEFPTNKGTPYPNIVLFVGGLGDGLLTVPYTSTLANALNTIGWGLVNLLISSSYNGFGQSSIAKDVYEISETIEYFRSSGRSKIVLMGHSTGCQDTIAYLSTNFDFTNNLIAKNFPNIYPNSLVSERPMVDAAIMQAPVSDRDALTIHYSNDEVKQSLEYANTKISSGKGDDFMPIEFAKPWIGAYPINCLRWKSLVAPHGDDDYFSYDLGIDKHYKNTFGKVKVPLLVIFSQNDEYVPSFVNPLELIEKWKTAISKYSDSNLLSPLSGVIQGATHDIGPSSGQNAVVDFTERVVKFLCSL